MPEKNTSTFNILLLIAFIVPFIILLFQRENDESFNFILTILAIIIFIFFGFLAFSSISNKKDDKKHLEKEIKSESTFKNEQVSLGADEDYMFTTSIVESGGEIIYSFQINKIEGFKGLPRNMQNLNLPNSFKNLYENLKSFDETHPFGIFKIEIVQEFFIPDDISALKSFVNHEYMAGRKDGIEKFVSPTLKKFVDTPQLKSNIFPDWFYCSYPDVAEWVIEGNGYSYSPIPPKETFDEYYARQMHGNQQLSITLKDLRYLINCFQDHEQTTLECIAES